MKTKLHLVLLLLSCIGYSQTPIASFYGEDGVSYLLGGTATAIDQTAAGANVNWNYTFNMVGASIHDYGTISGTELTAYPGSTTEEDIVWTPLIGFPTESKIYSKNPAGVVSVTGFENGDLVLNCVTNNATLGAFPMNYGYTNNDPIAGTYKYGTYTGTFTGNIVTTVDAYGTLNVNIGNVPANSNVTRLKTVQTISLTYPPLPNVGTASQTTYSYYGHAGIAQPLMKTTNTIVNVPLLSINSNNTDIEVFDSVLLGTDQFSAQANQIQIQNPVGDFLNLKADNVTLQSISISDMSGKIVLQGNLSENALNVSSLQKGIYTVTIQTNNGSETQKIIKK